jgi:hypothetical protein
MASIAELLDNAAAKNGGRVPRGFIPKVIQQFSKVTPGLTRDQINHCYKKEYKKERESGPESALVVLNCQRYHQGQLHHRRRLPSF